MSDKKIEQKISDKKIDYYRNAHAAQCFYLALKALELLEEHYDNCYLRDIYMCAFVINSTKPFKQDERRPKNLKINRRNGNPDIQFRDLSKVLYEKLLVLRDKCYAHTDLSIEDDRIVNKLLIESRDNDNGQIMTNAIFCTSGIRKEEIALYKDILNTLYDRFEQKSVLIREQHLVELRTPGFYELILDDQERWFIPTTLAEDSEPNDGNRN